MAVDFRDIITIEPGKRGAKPTIRGMRIAVYDILEYLASGMTEQEILADFPYLTRDDILACLQYAAMRERTMLSKLAIAKEWSTPEEEAAWSQLRQIPSV